MMNRKSYLLIFALLFPVGIFLFLKYFGRNEFDVPPLFLESSPVPEGCSPPSFPYTVNPSITDTLGLKPGVQLLLMFFPPANGEDSVTSYRQWIRVKELFGDQNVNFSALPGRNLKTDALMRCVFLMENPNTFAVVDSLGQIRGHYNGASLEDADRLVTELKIMLNKY